MNGRFIVALVATLVHCQTTPAFDVASIKPTQHGRDAEGWSRSSVDVPSPGRFVAQNSSLDELIRFAYDLKDYQISGPKWLNDDSESFDVLATASADASKDQVRLMLQALLRERFKLAAHRETKSLSIYELVVEKSGPKLGRAADPVRHASVSSAPGNMTAISVTMDFFANQLSRQLKRPVVDKTELPGAFDIQLHYQPGSDEASTTGALLNAIRDTTGLGLKSARGPVEVLVIDHIEKVPSEN